MPKDDGLDVSLLGAEIQPEVLTFFNGEITLYYDDWLHAYWREDGEGNKIIVPGSTTIGSTLDKSGPLTQWAANCVVEMLMANYPMDDVDRAMLLLCYQRIKAKETLPVGGDVMLPAMSVENFASLLNTARFHFKAIKETAADIGSVAHEWLERYIKGSIAALIEPAVCFAEPLPHLVPTVVEKLGEENAQKASNCVMAALDWFGKHNVRFLHSERKVYSRLYDYAGTADWFAMVTSCGCEDCCPFEGEKLINGDFKTSKGLWDTYFLQLASYVQAWEEEFPDQPIEGRLLMRLDKETGEFDTAFRGREDQEGDMEAFLGLLDAYIWVKQLELDRRYEKQDARAEKKALKEAEKAAKREEKARLKAEKDALKASRPKRERTGKRLTARGKKKVEETTDDIAVKELPVATTKSTELPPWDNSLRRSGPIVKPTVEDDDIQIKPIFIN